MRVRRVFRRGALVATTLALAGTGSAWGSPPTVTSVQPYWGPASGGTNVNIGGSGFEGELELRFGENQASKIFVGSPTSMAALSPPGAPGTVDVTVTTAEGTSAISSADKFTYLQAPEYGRCIKGFIGYGGGSAKSTCRGGSEFPSYFWFPAFAPKKPLQKRGFTLSGGEVKLKTAGKKLIVCTGANGAGEYTAVRSTAVSLTLTGCSSAPLGSCRSEGVGEGEVVLAPLTSQLGRVRSSLAVGEQLAPASGEVVAEFACAATAVKITGAVVGEVKKPGKMQLAWPWAAALKEGAQAIRKLDGGPEATLQASFGAGAPEAAALKALVTQTNEEAVEVIPE